MAPKVFRNISQDEKDAFHKMALKQVTENLASGSADGFCAVVSRYTEDGNELMVVGGSAPDDCAMMGSALLTCAEQSIRKFDAKRADALKEIVSVIHQMFNRDGPELRNNGSTDVSAMSMN